MRDTAKKNHMSGITVIFMPNEDRSGIRNDGPARVELKGSANCTVLYCLLSAGIHSILSSRWLILSIRCYSYF